MKIALFSDVHANLPALEAFFEVVEDCKPDAIYCLGDLVGYNVWPNEVIDIIRKRGIPTIAGNYDFGIGRNSNDCGCAYKSEEEKIFGKVSISFTNDIIKEDQRKFLRTLPSNIKLEFQHDDNKINLLLVHGSPRKINEYLFEDREEKSFLRILENSNADILCIGHTHKPYHRIFEIQSQQKFPIYKHAINIGSIGKPKDGNPNGGFVLLTINENSTTLIKDSILVEFIRFKYDIEHAAKAIEDSILPNKYADCLRNGI